jgi:hypothetical protein
MNLRLEVEALERAALDEALRITGGNAAAGRAPARLGRSRSRPGPWRNGPGVDAEAETQELTHSVVLTELTISRVLPN